jgi:uncharacterized OB-fold protein
MMDFSALLPDKDDPLLLPHWRGLREERLLVQRCPACGYLRWQPATVCPECLAPAGEWTEIAATGTLWSFTTYHRALHAAFREFVPYSVGLIALDAGPRMIGRLAVDEAELRIGMRMRAGYRPASPDITLMEWTAEDD